jgi:hypothetical protein
MLKRFKRGILDRQNQKKKKRLHIPMINLLSFLERFYNRQLLGQAFLNPISQIAG